MKCMDFKGKSVLITGSSRGIGRATAEAFLERGARVAINGRSKETVEATIKSLSSENKLVPALGDISTAKGCKSVVNSAISGLGGLDIVVNAAGILFATSIEDSTEEIWNQTLDINLKGTFFCSKYSIPALKKSGGNIINVASDPGLIGEKELSVYCASKGGVVNMTRAMALELAPQIRVNCVCPGYVDTDMIRRDIIDQSEDSSSIEEEIVNYSPLKRMAKPEEIAKAILYLASEDAANITGAALQIDGGSTAGH